MRISVTQLLTLFFLMFLNISCVANTYYYKSKNNLVLASGPKKFLSKPEFTSLVVECLESSLGDEYPGLSIQVNDNAIIDLSILDNEKISKIKDAKIEENAYIPNDLDIPCICYEFGNISIIVDEKSGKIVRLSVRADEDYATEVHFYILT